MRYFTCLAIFAALLTLGAPLSAPARALPPSLNNPSHQAKARAILTRNDAAIAKALVADPVLKAAMDKDLKAIAAITDPKQRRPPSPRPGQSASSPPRMPGQESSRSRQV